MNKLFKNFYLKFRAAGPSPPPPSLPLPGVGVGMGRAGEGRDFNLKIQQIKD
jgi:hypothetical protein